MDDIYLPVRRDGELCVPDTLGCLTTYVLFEQGDWFEREIAFVRRFMRPGMRALDIGSNYGIYTLALARAAGASGVVWAFEPTSSTADYLRKTIARNNLSNVQLRQVALSDHVGEGRLCVEANSELNRLSDEASNESERVQLSSVDHEQTRLDWGRIDFVKLDAEGEEVNILRGGEAFFADQSPLIMFEFVHGKTVNKPLLAAFGDRAYDIYRLIGPDRLLVPISEEDPADGWDLNLFACKADRAAALGEAGSLVLRSGHPEPVAGLGRAFWRRQTFAASFRQRMVKSDAQYEAALDFYALWRDESLGPAERYGALRSALAVLEACSGQRITRLATLARVANEAARWGLAVRTLERLLGLIQRGGLPLLDEPFWPPIPRYDGIAAGEDAWLLAATVEAFEQTHAYSGYFAEPSTLPLLEWLRSTRFATPEMERRRQLKSRRAGSSSASGIR